MGPKKSAKRMEREKKEEANIRATALFLTCVVKAVAITLKESKEEELKKKPEGGMLSWASFETETGDR